MSPSSISTPTTPASVDALPLALRGSGAAPVRSALLRRLTVALGYLPSWSSPTFSLQVRPPRAAGEHAPLTLHAGAGELPPIRNRMLRQVARRVLAAAPYLDLWPILPALQMAAGARVADWGGSFPHSPGQNSEFTTDALGRIGPWRRIHLVDSSVFPDVPATTFALTMMANSHRITEGALREMS